MKAHGIRRAAACTKNVALDRDAGKLAAEMEHECVDALVGDEEVGAEPDDRNRRPALGRPAQQLLELGD